LGDRLFLSADATAGMAALTAGQLPPAASENTRLQQLRALMEQKLPSSVATAVPVVVVPRKTLPVAAASAGMLREDVATFEINIANDDDNNNNKNNKDNNTSTRKRKEPSSFAAKDDNDNDNNKKVYIVGNPMDQDVLMGRGGRSNHHPGNMRYLQEKLAIQPRYQRATKEAKTSISQELVDAVYAWGGRFLQLDDTVQKWYVVISNDIVRKKAGQALREDNTPERRADKRAKYGQKKSNKSNSKRPDAASS
jgi:hypothetical protein